MMSREVIEVLSEEESGWLNGSARIACTEGVIEAGQFDGASCFFEARDATGEKTKSGQFPGHPEDACLNALSQLKWNPLPAIKKVWQIWGEKQVGNFSAAIQPIATFNSRVEAHRAFTTFREEHFTVKEWPEDPFYDFVRKKGGWKATPKSLSHIQEAWV